MPQYVVAQTDLADSAEAGNALGTQLREQLGGVSPDAVVLFASSRYDYAEFLRSVRSTCHPEVMIGASSAGEFTSDTPQEHSACAIGLHAPEMRFAAGVGRRVNADPHVAVEQMLASFRGIQKRDYAYR